MDIYIEPGPGQAAPPDSGSVARTLATLGKAIGYTVSVAAPDAEEESFPGVDLLQTALDLGELKSHAADFCRGVDAR